MQRAMNRAAFGNVQKPGALLVSELTLELHLSFNVVQLAGPRFAARAVPDLRQSVVVTTQSR